MVECPFQRSKEILFGMPTLGGYQHPNSQHLLLVWGNQTPTDHPNVSDGVGLRFLAQSPELKYGGLGELNATIRAQHVLVEIGTMDQWFELLYPSVDVHKVCGSYLRHPFLQDMVKRVNNNVNPSKNPVIRLQGLITNQ